MYPALIKSLIRRLSFRSAQWYVPLPFLAIDFILFHITYVLASIMFFCIPFVLGSGGSL